MELNERDKWPVWMTVQETAELLRVNPATIYEKVRRGELPVMKIGRIIRVNRDALFDGLTA